MACFLVGAAEALVVTAVRKHEEKVEKQREEEGTAVATTVKIPLSRKLKWLSNLLWGGVILLAFEHIWHGEVVPWFPFLTAMNNPADASEMFHEMATVGVTMAAIITVTWIVICKVADVIVARKGSYAAAG